MFMNMKSFPARKAKISVSGRRRSCFDFVGIVPVTVAEGFGEIAQHREATRVPLLHHVMILMHDQAGIGKELRGTASQIDAVAPCHGQRPAVKGIDP